MATALSDGAARLARVTFVSAKVTKTMVPAGWPAAALPRQVPESGDVLGGEQRPKCQWHFAALGAPGQGCPGRGVVIAKR